MLKEEFEKLVGRTATQEEYIQANFVYMMCGDRIDKETLCAEWPVLKDSKVVSDLANKLNKTGTRLSTVKSNLTIMAKALVDVMEANGVYEESAVIDLRDIMGDRWYVAYKAKQNYCLDETDRQYIYDNLK